MRFIVLISLRALLQPLESRCPLLLLLLLRLWLPPAQGRSSRDGRDHGLPLLNPLVVTEQVAADLVIIGLGAQIIPAP